jgi:hypothetical protein
MTKHLTALHTHFHVFAEDDLDLVDEGSPLELGEVLARLATQDTPLTPEQSAHLRAQVPRELGEAHDRDSRACIWRMDVQDAHGNPAHLTIRIPHEQGAPVTLGFVPPGEGTWIDERFSQEVPGVLEPTRAHDPTGGKAIAAKLLAQLK